MPYTVVNNDRRLFSGANRVVIFEYDGRRRSRSWQGMHRHYLQSTVDTYLRRAFSERGSSEIMAIFVVFADYLA